MISFTKEGSLNNVKTTITLTEDYLRGSRIIGAKVVTITTQKCETTGEFAVRANNMCFMTNEDFQLLSDVDPEDYED
ncbi:MAG: hypothetical protein DRI37_04240 [Chloroflexi bacterium]|nr:MAG: hypothetical protein DRI37_04240 [Chloroflexota bacterium]